MGDNVNFKETVEESRLRGLSDVQIAHKLNMTMEQFRKELMAFGLVEAEKEKNHGRKPGATNKLYEEPVFVPRIKVFISIPMAGFTNEQVQHMIKVTRVLALEKINKLYGYTEGELEFVDNYNENVYPEGVMPNIMNLGLALQKMSECKLFVIVNDDTNSTRVYRGCAIEAATWGYYMNENTVVRVSLSKIMERVNADDKK